MLVTLTKYVTTWLAWVTVGDALTLTFKGTGHPPRWLG